ncbi:uncharacterized protein ACNLHF_004433 [Anomaloglossus baeobatrachus]
MASAILRDELLCSICLSIFKDPVMLRCGHNFCRVCIDRVLDTQDGSGVYSCPECREEFQERPALMRNINLHNVAERFLVTQQEQEEITGICCTYCVDSPVPAVRSCLHCEASLCEKHLRAHSKSPEHVLSDPSTSLEKRKCSVHKKILEYYCTEDAACICVSCSVIGKHNGHKMESLDEASEKKKKKLRNVLQKLITKREETEERVRSLEEQRSKAQENAAGEAERVTALCTDIRRPTPKTGNLRIIDEYMENCQETEMLSEENEKSYSEPLSGWLNDIVQEAETASLEQGEQPNPYFCPDFSHKLLHLLKYFPIWTSVMQPVFQSPNKTASSASVEGDFGLLKNSILQHIQTPMRVDKFVALHLSALCGRSKIAAAVHVTESSSLVTLEKEEVIDESAKDKHGQQEKSHEKEVVSEHIKELTDTLLPLQQAMKDTSVFESRNTEQSVVELREEECWRGKTNSQLKIVHTPIAQNEGDNKSLKSKDLLSPLNIPFKKRPTYLTLYPNICQIIDDPCTRKPLGILRNGNLLNTININNNVYKVNNTCPFDSLLHSLSTMFVDYDSYRNFITNSEYPFLGAVKYFVEFGSNQNMYRKRAQLILENYRSYTLLGGITSLDAEDYIGHTVEVFLKDIPSLTEISTCQNVTCKNNKERCNIFWPINTNDVKHGFERAMQISSKLINKPCTPNCSERATIIYKPGPHLIIEPRVGLPIKRRISEFPTQVIISHIRYTLGAIIMHVQGNHYISYCRRKDSCWEVYDDMSYSVKTVDPNKLCGNSEVIFPLAGDYILYVVTQDCTRRDQRLPFLIANQISEERKSPIGADAILAMASAILRDELLCSICLSIFKDPVTLRCGHNFCRVCIDRVLDTQDGSGVYSCPDCREEFQERPALMKNINLHNVAERFLVTQQEQEITGICCTYCVDSPVPAVRSCLHCEASLCEKHLRAHSKSPEHVLSDPSTSLEKRKCSVHKKILEYYCTEDAACICVSCSLIGEHKGHKMESLDEASENKKKKLIIVLHKLITKRVKAVERVWSLEEQRRKAEEKAAGEAERVTALCTDIRRRVDDLEKKALSEISRQEKEESLSLSALIHQLEIKKDELSRKMRHIEELCNMTDPLTVLQEPDTGDLCDPEEEGGDEDTGGHDKQLHDGDDLDVAVISHTLHTLCEVITGIRRGIYVEGPADILLDVNTAANNLLISDDLKTATRTQNNQNRPETAERFQCNKVMSRRGFTSGRHHWDVEGSRSGGWMVGMCYPSIDRRGDQSLIGENNKSWILCRFNNQYSVIHDSEVIQLPDRISSDRVRICLDYEAGQLSFYELCDPIRHLHTFTAAFSEPLHAVLCVFMVYIDDHCVENWVRIRT